VDQETTTDVLNNPDPLVQATDDGSRAGGGMTDGALTQLPAAVMRTSAQSVAATGTPSVSTSEAIMLIAGRAGLAMHGI
jgi:hypothetical protein